MPFHARPSLLFLISLSRPELIIFTSRTQQSILQVLDHSNRIALMARQQFCACRPFIPGSTATRNNAPPR
ncbi:hypothetical protein BC829DRAFT_96633 [Chytridium lagenaria]|nr:hypothetical protein BC829DRAFT_96633 [Chytridium lagenaria]